jgi:hypothetical protein
MNEDRVIGRRLVGRLQTNSHFTALENDIG